VSCKFVQPSLIVALLLTATSGTCHKIVQSELSRSYSQVLFDVFTGPPKALDEDETEFLDALETVSMANCGGDMGTTNLSWGSLASGVLCLLA